MGCLDQFLGDVAIDARQADIEARPEEEGAVIDVEINLRIDLGTGLSSVIFRCEAANSMAPI